MRNTISVILLAVFGATSSTLAQVTKDAPSSRYKGQYNMSLQDKVITGPKGSLTSPQAASANKRGQVEEKSVRKIADGIYRIGGWGIGNIIAVEAPEGWVVVDTGDYLAVDVRALGLCLLAYTSLIPIRFGPDHLQPRRI